jgi:uncharacterized Zn finger protein (UPF0148 family)
MTTPQTQSICPYCGVTLEKRPQRKKKCPSCGNFIYVKTLPTTREKVLVTESQAEEIEKQWAAMYERRKWRDTLASYGISEADYDKEKLRLARQLGREVKDREIAWTLFSRLLRSTTDLQSLKMINYQMALFVEEDSGDFRPFLEKAAELELLNYKRSRVVRKVQVLSAGAGNSCEVCFEQDGKVYTIDEALKLKPIPCKGCTHTLSGKRAGFCRCLYNAVIE